GPARTATLSGAENATTTIVETVVVPPPLSTAVTATVYVPPFAYTCCATMAVPLTAPRSARAPSPKVMDTFWMIALLPGAAVAAMVNTVGVCATGFAPGTTDTTGWGRGA